MIVEEATGTWCVTCPGAAMGVKDLEVNGHNVAVIAYHYDDDFSSDESEGRVDYYGISAMPTLSFDGVDRYVGGDRNNSIYTNILPYVKERNNVKTGVTLSLKATQTDGNNYSVTVNLNKVGPVKDTSLVTYLVLTESKIQHSWQNQSEVDFAERLLLPDINGTPVDLANNSNISQIYNVSLDNNWDFSNLEIVAFVQNTITKEILNGTKRKLSKIVGLQENNMNEHDFSVYPNPAQTHISLKSLFKNSVIKIIDLQGRMVLKQNIGDMDIVTIDISGLKPGIYFAKQYKKESENVENSIKFVKEK